MFSKKPEAPQRASASKMGSPTFSVLGNDVTIKGDLSATAELHIDGKVEGDITCASLVQGETSEIIGAVTAETARLAQDIAEIRAAQALRFGVAHSPRALSAAAYGLTAVVLALYMVADRDRVRGMLRGEALAKYVNTQVGGMTLEQIRAARPSKEFDARFATESFAPNDMQNSTRWYEQMYNEAKTHLPAR